MLAQWPRIIAHFEVAIRRHPSERGGIVDDRDLGGRVAAESGDAEADLGDQTIEASIIKFVNQMLLDAYGDRATDIHFEPFEPCYRIRKRIDCVLYKVPILASQRHFLNACSGSHTFPTHVTTDHQG